MPAQQVFSEAAACTDNEIDRLRSASPPRAQVDRCRPRCLRAGTVQCSASLFALPPACLDAVLGSVGIPDVTVEAVVEAVTQPAGKFAFGGSLGLMLASKYPLEAHASSGPCRRFNCDKLPRRVVCGNRVE